MKKILLLSLLPMLLTLPFKAGAVVQFSAVNGQGKEIKYEAISVDPSYVKVIEDYYTGEVIIPSTVVYGNKTFTVKGVARYAFSNSSLTRVVLPETVDFIEYQAFKDCYNLQNIVIKSILKDCHVRAFENSGEALYKIDSPQATEDGKCLIVDNGLRLFAGSGITDYVLPESITSIDGNFEGLSSLKNITLPSALTFIGYRSFHECTSLQSIDIPDNVTKICLEAFEGCTSLRTLSLGTSVEVIEGKVFRDCDKLSDVDFPNSLQEIGDEAFLGCSKLYNVTFGTGLKSIGNSAFKNTNIIEANFSNGLKTLGGYVFENCKQLQKVTLPSTLTEMGYYVFSGCTALLSIDLPDNLIKIPVDAFYNCSSLQIVTVGANTRIIGTRAFCGCKNLVSVSLPDGLQKINNDAFCESGIISISIPESVTEIEDNAFYNCSRLGTVTFGGNLRKIGNWAFQNSAVTEIVLPDNLTEIGFRAFQGCQSLKSVKYGANTYYTGDYAFVDCINLEKVELGGMIYTISKESFRNCQRLTDLTMSPVVTNIESSAFENCVSLPEITLGQSVSTIGNFAFKSCSSLKEIVIPNSVSFIGNGVLAWCTSLEKITLSDNILSVGWGLFAGCNRLEKFSGKFATPDGRSFVFRNVLKGVAPYGLSEYTTPSSISYNGATYNVESIERGCFHYIHIDDVTVAEPIKHIGFDAFLESEIHSVTLGNSVEDIRSYAFRNCPNLHTVVIGENVTHIFEQAFKDCLSLNELYLYPDIPPTGGSSRYESDDNVYKQTYYDYLYNGVFENVDKEMCTVHVPKESKQLYQRATGWCDFINYVIIKEPNRLEAGQMKAKPLGGVALTVDMYNTEEISAFQCDIKLPEGVSVRLINGEPDVTLSSRATRSHSLDASMVNSNTLRLVSYSSQSKPFAGNDGLLFTVALVAPGVEGEHNLTIGDIHLTTTNGAQFTPEDVVITLEVASGTKGDANEDDEVNVTDLVYMTNFILGYNPEGFNFGNADVNEDGDVNVTDVVETVNIILEEDNAEHVKVQSDEVTEVKVENEKDESVSGKEDNKETSAKLYVADFVIEPGTTAEEGICLSNPDYPVTAIQFKMTLPEGLSVESENDEYFFDPTSRLTRSHLIGASCNDGVYTVLSYSSKNSNISDSDGAVISMTLVADESFVGGTVHLFNIIVTEADGTQHRLEDSVTTVWKEHSSIELTTNDESVAEYFDLGGRRHNAPLTPGFYIRLVNGTITKVLVK